MKPTDPFLAVADLFGQSNPAKSPKGTEKVGKSAAESTELGMKDFNDGAYESAIEHLQRALEQTEGSRAEALQNLAAVYAATDRLPEAYRRYEQALRDRATAENLLGLGEIMRRYGRNRDAIEHLERAIELEPEQPHPYFAMAQLLRDLGERKRAVAYTKEAIVRKPDEAFYHFFVAEILAERSEFDEAIAAYRAAVELSPGDDHYLFRTAVAFWRANRQAEAIKSLQLAGDLATENQFYRAALALMLERNGRLADAAIEAGKIGELDAYDSDRLERLQREIAG